jgi:DNA polymerase-3 subunit epsilon
LRVLGPRRRTMVIAFIDTETTGLDPSRAEVIEFAAVKVSEDGTEEVFHTLVCPQRIDDADVRALEINGYARHPERWDTAPTMAEVGPQILAFLKGTVICGHNVAFDEAMLNANLAKAGAKGRIPYHKVDTVTLAYEHLVPLGLERLSLDSIRAFLGWSKVGSHTAMKDAEDVQRLYNLTNRMGLIRRLVLRFHIWRRGVA